MIPKVEKSRNNNMNTLKYKRCKKSLQDLSACLWRVIFEGREGMMGDCRVSPVVLWYYLTQSSTNVGFANNKNKSKATPCSILPPLFAT